jgi:cell division protein FtsB
VVAHLFPDEVEYETEHQPEHEPKRRRWVPIAAVAGLALFGVVSAFAWHTYGGGPLTLPSFAFATGQPAAPAVVADKPVGLKDLQALQQQVAGSVQSTAQLLATQQAEIKRLADQVAVLAAKVDLLERPAASAQASLPAAQPVAPAARKKPAAPKPLPGISTGGAPLPPAQPGR